MVSSLLLALAVARAACPDPEPHLADAERDALSFFVADAQVSLNAAADAFACQRVEPALLGRYWLAQAMLWSLAEDARLPLALAAARRDAPGVYTDAFGDALREQWASTPVDERPPVAFRLRGGRRADALWIDARPAAAPEAPPGLHLIQVLRDGEVLLGRIVDLQGELEIAVPTAPDTAVGGVPVGWSPPWPGPLTTRGRSILAADGRALDLHTDVLPVALLTPEGAAAWRDRRASSRRQLTALGIGAAGGYTTYVFGWELLNGENLPRGLSTAGFAVGVAALGTGLGWELALIGKRRASRRRILEAAQTFGSDP